MAEILTADDEPSVRMLYEAALRSHSLTSTKTGEEAITALERMLSDGKKPALVITDNKMPPGKLTGMNVIDYVKEKCPDVPVIMIASETPEMTVEQIALQALQKGASAYLSKPFNLKELLETVEKYVK